MRPRTILIVAVLILVFCVAVVGVGIRPSDYDTCMKQADRVLDTQGMAAFNQKVDSCVSAEANGTR